MVSGEEVVVVTTGVEFVLAPVADPGSTLMVATVPDNTGVVLVVGSFSVVLGTAVVDKTGSEFVVSGCGTGGVPSTVVVVCTRAVVGLRRGTTLPVTVGMAYGGSNKPNLPQALHGDAQAWSLVGAARMGSQGPPATVVTSADCSAV